LSIKFENEINLKTKNNRMETTENPIYQEFQLEGVKHPPLFRLCNPKLKLISTA